MDSLGRVAGEAAEVVAAVEGVAAAGVQFVHHLGRSPASDTNSSSCRTRLRSGTRTRKFTNWTSGAE